MKRMITIFRTPALQACWGRGASKVRTGMLLLTMLFSSVTTWADTYKLTFHLNGGTHDEFIVDSYDSGEDFNLMKPTRERATFKGWYTTKDFEEGTQIADVKGRTGDLEVWAKWECDPVTYIDENGEEHTTTEYVELKGSTELASLDDSYDWYVVRGENVVYYSQIGSTKDNLHIILMDGAKLTTQGTFPLQCNGNMSIYGQSQGTGQLVATSNPAYGLYAIKSITINGGTINATGGDFGISAIEGNVTINGGTVTAHGKDYFGIEGPNVIINGGSVTATSDTYHGISVNGTGTIAINGGSVTASHGSDVDVSYYGNVKIGPGKAYTTGTDGTIYCGTLTEDELKAIDSQTLQPTTWDGGTTAETATVLTTPKHLELLAQCVNGGNDFSGKFFKLGGDIAYDAAMLTIDNDGDGTPESNHTPIGDASHAFTGTLDGQNHTISGLRITSASRRQGLFGSLGSTGVVKNVTLSDASIAGNDYTAGIVSYNLGTVANCQVDNTVALHCAQNYYDSFGGIVGYNGTNGIVSECTSSVTVTVADGVTAINHFGGVVGNNNSTVNGCLAVGVVIPDVNHHGAVVGLNQSDGILTANYYTACTVAGVENATNVGCNSSDIEGAKIIYKLTLGEGVSTSTPATITHNDINYYAQGVQVTLTATSVETPGYQKAFTAKDESDADVTISDDNTFTMPASSVTISLAVVDWATVTDGNSEETAYIIYNKDQLDLLSARTNAGEHYAGKFFKLGNDITYSHTTEWNDATSTENNFTPIGEFHGSFDGDGHTISGIRIYCPGNTSNDNWKGLFSQVGNSPTLTTIVKNLFLADARITGLDFVGGIAGIVDYHSTISGCYVLSNVAIHGVQNGANCHGGIVGLTSYYSKIDHCVSAATLTKADGVSVSAYGGIVGQNQAEVCNNLVIGASIPVEGNGFGTVIGKHADAVDGTSASNNYYTACTVAGAEKTAAVGCGAKTYVENLTDLTDNDGAVPALRDDADNTTAIGLLAQVPDAFKPLEVALTGRTLYKDGKWNTLCLPFNVTLAGSALNGATARPLTAASISGSTLNLTFGKAVTELVAGTPYIIKWDAAETNIESPVFSNVTIDATDRSYDNAAEGDARVRFMGTYKSTAFNAEDKSILLMGGENKLYYPTTGAGIGAQRAYFKIGDGTELARQLTSFNISFGDDETTGIENEELRMKNGESATATGWYSLDGRRLAGKPAQHGVYINNGKKLVIK